MYEIIDFWEEKIHFLSDFWLISFKVKTNFRISNKFKLINNHIQNREEKYWNKRPQISYDFEFSQVSEFCNFVILASFHFREMDETAKQKYIHPYLVQ